MAIDIYTTGERHSDALTREAISNSAAARRDFMHQLRLTRELGTISIIAASMTR